MGSPKKSACGMAPGAARVRPCSLKELTVLTYLLTWASLQQVAHKAPDIGGGGGADTPLCRLYGMCCWTGYGF